LKTGEDTVGGVTAATPCVARAHAASGRETPRACKRNRSSHRGIRKALVLGALTLETDEDTEGGGECVRLVRARPVAERRLGPIQEKGADIGGYVRR